MHINSDKNAKHHFHCMIQRLDLFAMAVTLEMHLTWYSITRGV